MDLSEQQFSVDKRIERIGDANSEVEVEAFRRSDHLNEEQLVRLLFNLKKNNSLQCLLLRDVGLTHDDAVLLSSVLQTHKKLEYLCLDSNQISGRGMVWLLNAVEKNPRLKYLSLRYQKIPLPEGQKEAIVEAAERTTSLRGLQVDLDNEDLENRLYRRLAHNRRSRSAPGLRRRCTLL